MKTSWLLSLIELAVLARKASCTDYPLLPYDPKTTSDCADWFNNENDQSCEWVRNYFKATPEEFTHWNPSVGLDCKPWYNWNSYCIITWTKVNQTQTTTTSTRATTSTSTSPVPVLGPSPTAWTDKGCYAQNPTLSVLETNFNPNGDAALSVPKCWQTCYRRFFKYAGVQNGNQCLCGSFIGGEWAANQTDCNSPCTGAPTTFCGGPSRIRIFQAEANVPVGSSTTTTGTSRATTATSTARASTTTGTTRTTTNAASGGKRNIGAVENLGMFWDPMN